MRNSIAAVIVAGIAVAGGVSRLSIAEGAEMKVPVTISGGHEIGKKDFGRPVALIAAGLQVEPDVFRKAFSGVTPARGRGPTGEEARRNKDALMSVLAPYGVTNDRLDEVSNYYRYQPQRGELWPTRAAKAHAVIENGKIKKIVVTEAGSGYCSPPTAKIDGLEVVELRANLSFSENLKKNGGISSIEVVPPKLDEKKSDEKQSQ